MTTERDDYEWSETHGDGEENCQPPGDGWEYVGDAGTSSARMRVSRWRRKLCRADTLRHGAETLLSKWVAELRDHPASSEGRYSAVAVAGCIKDLRALLGSTK